VTSEAISVKTAAPARLDLRRSIRAAREFLVHAVIQDRVLQRLYPGIMHFCLFWGVTVQVLGTVVNLTQQKLFIPFALPWPTGASYLWFELVMDVAGGMILIGVVMAGIRRTILRPASLVSRWDDWLALALLTLIALLGFATEGIRLMSVQPGWRLWSPIGNAFAYAFSSWGLSLAAGLALHPYLVASHAVAGLALVAVIPFTKLRHLVTGPLNIVLRPERKTGELSTIEDIEQTEKLGVGQVADFTTQTLLSFDACVQCGRCETVCPAAISGMPYSPRTLVLSLYDNMHANLGASKGAAEALLEGSIAKETPWYCTTCGACMSVCPMFIDPVSSIVDLRRYLTLTTGDVPGSVGEALTQMERRGNPWGLDKANRAPWIQELGVRVLKPGDKTDILLFVGCAYGYDARSQQAARELVHLLQRAGVDFAVLGAAEGCCGETARRLGHEYIFQTMANENIASLSSVTFNRIVAPCAHCFNTIKNEYPHFGAEFQVIHHTQLLAELAQQGRLHTSSTPDGKVYTFHDSCYLGRYNEIYSEPRKLLDGVPELKRTEMPRRLADGFCCGGGGGQMWMETDPNTRINKRRLEEAVERAKADVVVAACPYCLIMFDDAIRSTGSGDKVAVKELSEVLTQHMRG
jgi:Fe-S oxidoreductase/nitrate reductase gamma subunit